VENKKARISARMIAWENSPTNANRIRMRGGDRGRRPAAELDAEDLDDAVKCLETGRKEIAHVHGPDVAALPRAQKDEVKAAAVSWLERAKRWIDEVLVRNGAPPAPKADPVDEE
jgi:hypothetical protein